MPSGKNVCLGGELNQPFHEGRRKTRSRQKFRKENMTAELDTDYLTEKKPTSNEFNEGRALRTLVLVFRPFEVIESFYTTQSDYFWCGGFL